MASNLGKFLGDLAIDPGKARDLRDDPDTAMDEAGLDEAEKQILRRADPDEIRRHLLRDNPHMTGAAIIVVTIFLRKE